MEDYYNKSIDGYYNHEKEMFIIYNRSHQLAICPYIEKEEGALFIDIAGGGGSYSLALKARYPKSKFIVIDCLEQALYAGRQLSGDLNLEVEFIHGSATKLPFADNSVDYMIVRKAIYLIYPLDTFLSEAYRVLKPNGKIFIIKHINFPWYPIYYMIKDWNFDFIRKKGSYIHLKYWLSSTKILRLLKKHSFHEPKIIPTDFMMKDITNLKPYWLREFLSPFAVKPFIIANKKQLDFKH